MVALRRLERCSFPRKRADYDPRQIGHLAVSIGDAFAQVVDADGGTDTNSGDATEHNARSQRARE